MGERITNRWERHQRALALAVADVRVPAFARSVEWFGTGDFEHNLAFIDWHGLSSLCEDQLRRAGALGRIPETVSQRLLASCRNATARYLAQSSALSRVAAALDGNEIEYVVLKGVATREEAYADPALRSTGDIDLLVRHADRQVVCRQLANLGFSAQAEMSPSAHEITYSRGQVDVDLHWDILRPGRTRRPLADALISRRVRGPKVWRLDDADTVFLMLVHPAFAKYVCSSNMGLNRVVDMLLFVRTRKIDWPSVADRLVESGLCTAAWCTLQWVRMLDPGADVAPDSFLRRIGPGRLRQAYLEQWLIHDWPGRLLGHADWLIQGAFTLPLHDRGADAWRALRYRALPPVVTTADGSTTA